MREPLYDKKQYYSLTCFLSTCASYDLLVNVDNLMAFWQLDQRSNITGIFAAGTVWTSVKPAYQVFHNRGKCRPVDRIDFHSMFTKSEKSATAYFYSYDAETRLKRTIMCRLFRKHMSFCYKRNWKLHKKCRIPQNGTVSNIDFAIQFYDWLHMQVKMLPLICVMLKILKYLYIFFF